MAKFNLNQVEDVIERYHRGESQSSIARFYSVDNKTICAIINGKTWKKVPRPSSLCRGTKSDQLLQLPDLTEFQKSIILGSLLGDGCIHKPKAGKNAKFLKCQAIKNRDYLHWTYEKLMPFSSKFYEKEMSGISVLKGRVIKDENKPKLNSCWMYTSAHPVFTEFYKEWYQNGKKIIPKDLILNELIVAIWFFDDGYQNAKRRTKTFYTNGFTYEECLHLCNQLKNFKIESKVVMCKNNNGNMQPVIKILKNDSFIELNKIIEPFVFWDCMKYKVDLTSYEPPKSKNGQPMFNVTKKQHKEIFKLQEKGYSQRRISKIYNISQSSVWRLLHGAY